MLTQRLSNTIFGVLVLVVCAYFAVVAEGFEAAGLLASSGLPSKFFPQLLLGFTALCAAVMLYVYVRGDGVGDAGETVFETPSDARRGLLSLLASVVCYYVWKHFGYIPLVLLSGPLLCLAIGERNPVIYGINLALAVCVYLVFSQLLGTQF